MYKLQKTPDGDIASITIIGQAITIPTDPANTDYQAYLEWVAEGNTPQEVDV